jgi:hypothetical protein
MTHDIGALQETNSTLFFIQFRLQERKYMLTRILNIVNILMTMDGFWTDGRIYWTL